MCCTALLKCEVGSSSCGWVARPSHSLGHNLAPQAGLTAKYFKDLFRRNPLDCLNSKDKSASDFTPVHLIVARLEISVWSTSLSWLSVGGRFLETSHQSCLRRWFDGDQFLFNYFFPPTFLTSENWSWPWSAARLTGWYCWNIPISDLLSDLYCCQADMCGGAANETLAVRSVKNTQSCVKFINIYWISFFLKGTQTLVENLL